MKLRVQVRGLVLLLAGIFCCKASAVEPALAEVTTPVAEQPFLPVAAYPDWAAMTPQQYSDAADIVIFRARERMQKLHSITPESANFDNTFRYYHDCLTEIAQLELYAFHLCSACNVSSAWSSVINRVKPRMVACAAELFYDARIVHLLRSAAEKPWVKTLPAEKQRFIRLVLQGFGGRTLSPEENKKKFGLQNELRKLLGIYESNIYRAKENVDVIIRNREELAGVSPYLCEALKLAALQRGLGTAEHPVWLITIKGNAVNEVLRQCSVESTRRRCWEAAQAPGKKNADIVLRIAHIRWELARLVGYNNHADYKLKDSMMGDSDRALAFVDGMLHRFAPYAASRNAALLQGATELYGKATDTINPWDIEYLKAKLRESEQRFNSAALRPYFEQENVLQGMFSLFGELYGLRITELPAAYVPPSQSVPSGKVSVWHPSVRVFAVHDAAGGEYCGSFYLDLYSRQGKQSLSWSQSLTMEALLEDGTKRVPQLVVMMLNLTPPSEGMPNLLSHLEVRTLFHEFGHVLHLILGRSELRELAAAKQAIDFVELPSHLHENWTWQPDALCSFARHYRTGEPLPRELAEKLAASRYAQMADEYLTSLLAAKEDLELHTHYAEKFLGRELDEAMQALLEPWLPPTRTPLPSVLRNLPHCMTVGYDACFYSYALAKVMSADVFAVFHQQGIRNSAVGKSYRRAVLEPGNSRPAAELYRSFMGRSPKTEAFLNALGL
ncbi:MAG: M3 family metallopeptidase [Akkermansia sp.]|nr:M3 family metallopeptidase [Akkermansia sp.]